MAMTALFFILVFLAAWLIALQVGSDSDQDRGVNIRAVLIGLVVATLVVFFFN